MKGKIIIRPAGSTDLAKINAIFNYYVAHSTCVWTTVPCSEAERAAWYEEHGGSMPVWLQNPAETWLAGAHSAHSGPLIPSLAPWKIPSMCITTSSDKGSGAGSSRN